MELLDITRIGVSPQATSFGEEELWLETEAFRFGQWHTLQNQTLLPIQKDKSYELFVHKNDIELFLDEDLPNPTEYTLPMHRIHGFSGKESAKAIGVSSLIFTEASQKVCHFSFYDKAGRISLCAEGGSREQEKVYAYVLKGLIMANGELLLEQHLYQILPDEKSFTPRDNLNILLGSQLLLLRVKE